MLEVQTGQLQLNQSAIGEPQKIRSQIADSRHLNSWPAGDEGKEREDLTQSIQGTKPRKRGRGDFKNLRIVPIPGEGIPSNAQADPGK